VKRLLPLAIALAVTLLGAVASGQSKEVAQQHFSLGLDLFQARDYRAAIAEFERALQAKGYAVIHYNIGLSYAALDEPVRAAESLEQALSFAPPLKPNLRAPATTELDKQRARIAKVTIACNVEGAAVTFRGDTVGDTPIATAVQVPAGQHVLHALAQGYAPHYQEINVGPGATVNVNIELHTSDKTPATIAVKTKLPGARLYVDDQLVGVTPLDITKLPVEPGARRVELRREGYVTAQKTLTLAERAEAEIVLEPEEDAAAISQSGGTLKLDLAQPDAAVYLNGTLREVTAQGIRLASGPHSLRLERTGHAPVEQQVLVPSGGTITTAIDLPLLPETRAARLSEAESDRTAGIALTIAGSVLTAAGIGVLIWNAASFDPSKPDPKQVQEDCHVSHNWQPEYDDLCIGIGEDAEKDRDLVTGLYAGSAIAIAAGSAGIIAGVVYLTTGEDPDLFRIPLGDELATLHLDPSFVGVTGTF
jgi:tetratricopeptide (TPR) repeat protein